MCALQEHARPAPFVSFMSGLTLSRSLYLSGTHDTVLASLSCTHFFGWICSSKVAKDQEFPVQVHETEPQGQQQDWETYELRSFVQTKKNEWIQCIHYLAAILILGGKKGKVIHYKWQQQQQSLHNHKRLTWCVWISPSVNAGSSDHTHTVSKDLQ